jgi:hypothetical protein
VVGTAAEVGAPAEVGEGPAAGVALAGGTVGEADATPEVGTAPEVDVAPAGGTVGEAGTVTNALPTSYQRLLSPTCPDAGGLSSRPRRR